MRSLLVFVAVAATLTANIAHGASCVGFSGSCKECAAQLHCGWNVGTRKCMAGYSGGPYVGSASQGWDYTVDSCENNAGPTNKACMGYSSCTSCLQNGNECGWDQRVLKCLLGNSTGPINSAYDNSGAPEWSWGHASVACPPAPECHQYSTCSKCTTSPSGDCGWNALTSTCVEGNANGPSGNKMSNTDDWKFVAAQCPSNTNNNNNNQNSTNVNYAALCAKHATCYNCTRSASTRCGWTGKRCLFGTPAGPEDALQSTNFWGWTADQCVYSHSWDQGDSQYATNNVSCSRKLSHCSTIDSCMACVNPDKEYGNCNWEKDTMKCVDPAFSSTSGNYAYSGSPRDCFISTASCSGYTNCTGCTGARSGVCGWDADMGRCVQGTPAGPTSGYTRRWFFVQNTCPKISSCADLQTCTSCFNSGAPHTLTTTGSEQVNCMWSFIENTKQFQCAQVNTFPVSLEEEYWDIGQCPYVHGDSGEADVLTECGAYTCLDCALMANCGWDANAKRCRAGTYLGPNSGNMPRMWNFSPDQCGTEQCGGTCESNNDCFTCSQSINCVWSYDADGQGNTGCVSGNSNGPFKPHTSAAATYGSTFAYGISSCPESTECSLQTDCHQCTSTAMCGWATGSGGCSAGNDNGPYDTAFAYTGVWVTTRSGCPASWTFRWSANSISMWLTVGGAILVLVAIVCLRCCRARRLAAAQRAALAAPLVNGTNATTGLLATGAQPVNGTVYGSAAQAPTTGVATGAPPAYGATTGAGGAASSSSAPYPYGQACYDIGAQQDSNHTMPMMEEIED